MRRILNVPMVEQNNSPVCWLACAYMLLQFHQGRTVRGGELDFPHGNFRQDTVHGFRSDAKMYRFLESKGFRQHVVGPRGRPTMGRQHAVENLAFDFIREKIDAGRPLIFCHRMGGFSYGSGLRGSGGDHAVVITGYDSDRSSVFFNNPWGQSNVPTTMLSIEAAVQEFEQRQPFGPFLTYGR